MDDCLNWKSTELVLYDMLRVKCGYYVYSLMYVIRIYFSTYKINDNISYLLYATYIMRCTGFVFGSETIHCACGCSTLYYPVFPQV